MIDGPCCDEQGDKHMLPGFMCFGCQMVPTLPTPEPSFTPPMLLPQTLPLILPSPRNSSSTWSESWGDTDVWGSGIKYGCLFLYY